MNDQHNPYHNPQQSQPPHLPPQGSASQYGSYAPYPQPPSVAMAAPEKHAELGIASLILSVLMGMALFVMFVIAGVMESSSPDGLDEESAGAMILGLLLILGIGFEFVALGLGLGSLFQPNRKKLLGILGLVISLLTLFVLMVVIILGAMLD
jgi:hypothetical protein